MFLHVLEIFAHKGADTNCGIATSQTPSAWGGISVHPGEGFSYFAGRRKHRTEVHRPACCLRKGKNSYVKESEDNEEDDKSDFLFYFTHLPFSLLRYGEKTIGSPTVVMVVVRVLTTVLFTTGVRGPLYHPDGPETRLFTMGPSLSSWFRLKMVVTFSSLRLGVRSLPGTVWSEDVSSSDQKVGCVSVLVTLQNFLGCVLGGILLL